MSHPDEILRFWFGDVDERGEMVAKEKRQMWFQKSDETDERIRTTFGGDVERALLGELDHWRDALDSRVALILLLDQFTRNIFRGTPRAFAGDERARELSLQTIEEGADTELPAIQRAFAYLPLEHAEDEELQKLSVAKFTVLAESVSDEAKEFYEGYLDYAVRHKEVIDRFGRYPHRNEILGRESTDDELEYLEQPDAGF